MKERDILVLEVDASQAEEGLYQITQSIGSLKTLAGEISAAFSAAFQPLIASLGQVEASVYTMSNALVTATESMRQLADLAVSEAVSEGANAASGDTTLADEVLEILLSGALGAAIDLAATKAINALAGALKIGAATAGGLVAAIAFLTSPIGLVVVAITALIAIVVLLVKNWDTVKAAAISVWESIKSAFGTAAAWFNENVVQPVAGFFSGLWDGFKEAAANAWEGVKSVFPTTENIS